MPVTADKKSTVDPLKIKLIKLTSTYCQKHLDAEYAEYAEICQRLIEKMARKRIVPFLSGKLEVWAASIIYAIGKVNFLSDKSFKPYASQKDIANYFKVSEDTIGQKSKKIREMFKMSYYNEEFFLPIRLPHTAMIFNVHLTHFYRVFAS